MFLLLCLLLAHTYTAIIGALFIIACSILDLIINNVKSKKIFFGIIPVAAFGGLLINSISKEREILSLGGRVSIWRASIAKIKEIPHGVGLKFRGVWIPLENGTKVDNCHNIFLNEAFRFSIPVAISYTLLFMVIVLYSLKYKFSFLRLGIWLAVIIQLSMDYSLLATDLSIFLFLIYCIFFLPLSEEDNINPEEHNK